MGQRNIDRVPPRFLATGIPDVGSLIARGWIVHSRCATCGVKLTTPLAALAALYGPTLSLWDRHPRCRAVGCYGRVTYWGQPTRHSPDFAFIRADMETRGLD